MAVIAADVIATRLREAGVRHLFGVPGGGSSLDLIEAAARVDLPFVLSHTETAGALMALAQTEITGDAGACLAALGPGAASMVNGVACASLDRAPLLAFTDRHPASAAHYPHQSLLHDRLFEPITKGTMRLETGAVDRTMRMAVRAAMAHPRGPVHLDCAPDVSSATCVAEDISPAGGPAAKGFSPAALTDDVLSLIRGARRPLLIAGLGARSAASVATIRTLCARGIPALVTYKAKGIVPDDDPAFAGVFTNGAIEQTILREADLLIGAGLDPVELIPRRWIGSQPIVYCGPYAIADTQIPYEAQIVDDFARVADLLPRLIEWEPEAVRRMVDRDRASIRVKAREIAPHAVIDIVATIARDARIAIDAGAHMFPATMLWPAREPGDVLISNGLSTMGFALPAAIGAALADPARHVVAFTGDAGLLMCAAELRTAARERLKIVVVVFDDQRLSLIDVKQRQRGYREAGVAMGRVDWESLARGFGVPAFVADSESTLERACRDAMALDGPALIAARIDASAYDAIISVVRG